MSLLYVDASFRAEGSISRAVAATYVASWRQAHPEGELVHRDLGLHPLPHLTEQEFNAAHTPAADRTPEQARGYAAGRAVIDEFAAAEALLVATPLYNWGVPSAVKSWIDHLLLDTSLGEFGGRPLKGRPAIIVAAKGGGYGPGAPKEGWDHATPYLHRIFADFYGFDTTIIGAELTLARVNPAMADLVDRSDDLLARAHSDAAEHAAALGAEFAARAA